MFKYVRVSTIEKWNLVHTLVHGFFQLSLRAGSFESLARGIFRYLSLSIFKNRFFNIFVTFNRVYSIILFKKFWNSLINIKNYIARSIDNYSYPYFTEMGFIGIAPMKWLWEWNHLHEFILFKFLPAYFLPFSLYVIIYLKLGFTHSFITDFFIYTFWFVCYFPSIMDENPQRFKFSRIFEKL